MSQRIDCVAKQVLADDGIFDAFGFYYDYDYVEILLRVQSTYTSVEHQYMDMIVNKDLTATNYNCIGSSIRGGSYAEDTINEPNLCKIPTAESTLSTADWAYIRVLLHRPLDNTYATIARSYSWYLHDSATSIVGQAMTSLIHFSGPASPDNVWNSIYFEPNNYPTSLFSAGSWISVMGWRNT